MFCSACCKREQPITVVLPDQPSKSEPGSGNVAPFAAEQAEAGDPFVAAAERAAAQAAEKKAAQDAPGEEPQREDQASSENPKKDEASDQDQKGFTLILDRSDPAQPLGALFDASMPSELYVSAVLNGVDGLVQNAERQSSAHLMAGDFIVSVNGISGSEMPKELQNAKRLELSVRRPREYDISITKTGSLGCSITYDANTGVALGVASVLDGPIEAWNAKARSSGNHNEVVQEGDRIIAVNGKRGYTSQLLELIHGCTELRITLARASRDR